MPRIQQRRVLGCSVDSWEDCRVYALSESQRTRQTVYAVEYMERDSRDGMKFYEATDNPERLAEHYTITRTETFDR